MVVRSLCELLQAVGQGVPQGFQGELVGEGLQGVQSLLLFLLVNLHCGGLTFLLGRLLGSFFGFLLLLLWRGR